jgi:hypothetical protein
LNAVPLLLIATFCAAGVVPPLWKLKERLAGLTPMVGAGGGAFTVIAWRIVPVPPPKLSMAAAYSVAVVVAVTVGAVQLNVQL